MIASKPRPRRRSRRRAKDDHKVLLRAILRLPVDLRDVFVLHRMAGMTYGEISVHLDMDPEAVEANLAAALLRIMKAVGSAEA